ncbi:hypothetical protein PKHYL_04040 [Psychrobacter sp. KH172YL61]|uniref:hypothetical protein n=1 Tax=Psychrobacter sp. KH172YL61 TaxID=2517899 RepID=UPI0010B49550|nr:hypothetical protein PKHYL_04040 [Psychrobacter sp. KH172YL61]
MQILNTPKGEMVIPCVIDDRESDSDRDPIVVEMTWAWIPKSELEARRQGKAHENASENNTDTTVDNEQDDTLSADDETINNK